MSSVSVLPSVSNNPPERKKNQYSCSIKHQSRAKNIINTPLKIINNAVGKIGGDMGMVAGALAGGAIGGVARTLIDGSLRGLLMGGIGLALGGTPLGIVSGAFGLFAGGSYGGTVGGVEGFRDGALLGKKIGQNISKFPLNVMQKGIETIANTLKIF